MLTGGHTQIYLVEICWKLSNYLGESIDDALGETFDKVAKLLGLGYPGGPLIEETSIKLVIQISFSLPHPLRI